MDTYYVTRIEEPDFGCEGRPEGQEIKDKVYLKEEIIQLNDYKDMMIVVIDGDGWNQYCKEKDFQSGFAIPGNLLQLGMRSEVFLRAIVATTTTIRMDFMIIFLIGRAILKHSFQCKVPIICDI